MEIKEIVELMKSFDASGCSGFEIQQGEFSLKLEKNKAAQEKIVVSEVSPSPAIRVEKIEPVQVIDSEAKTEAEPEGELVKAPMVGIFYAAASPEAEAYVQVGSHVEKDDVICLIEAMKMMSEIRAPRAGVIKKIYVKNQDVIGFEDPLFLIG